MRSAIRFEVCNKPIDKFLRYVHSIIKKQITKYALRLSFYYQLRFQFQPQS